MSCKLVDGPIKLIFEENGKNFLIYRLHYCDQGMENSSSFWREVKEEFNSVSEVLKNYSNNFSNEDWDDFKKIKYSYERYAQYYNQSVKDKLEQVIRDYELEKYKDLVNELKGLRVIIKIELDNLWKKIQYGIGVKDTITSSHSVVISRLNKIEEIIVQRLGLYQQFQDKYNKSLVLLTKVYINDLKEKDYEIVFSFENSVNPDLSIFLYQEVYRLLKDDVVPTAEREINQLQLECCSVFAYLKEAPLHKFLCRLDHLFVKINAITSNRIFYSHFASLELGTFIERFRVVEKLFSSKLIETKKVSERFFVKIQLPGITQSDFSLLVMWELLAMNCAQLLTLKNNPDWDNKIADLCLSLYNKLQNQTLDQTIASSPVKIIPWQTLAAINPKYAEKFLDAWKEQFLKKQYPEMDNIKGFLLTGTSYVDDEGEYPEAVCIYLYGIQNQSYIIDKRSSIEKSEIVIQQKGLAMNSNSSIKIGIQFSVMVDRCILNSKNKERFAV